MQIESLLDQRSKNNQRKSCCQGELNPGPRRPCPLQLATPPTPSLVSNDLEETQVNKLAVIGETKEIKLYCSAPNLVFRSRQ
jgi:hypothetical protein